MNTVQSIRTMEVVGLQSLILQGMLGADCNNRLGRPQRLKTFGPAGLLAPGILLLQHMEQGHHVSQTAVAVKVVSVV